jgi:hypothetical protein
MLVRVRICVQVQVNVRACVRVFVRERARIRVRVWYECCSLCTIQVYVSGQVCVRVHHVYVFIHVYMYE